MINKDHLKYKTTTLTLGNISSVEQLVPPLSLWKGVPGAASPCPAPSDSLPAPALPALAMEALRGLGREAEGAHQRPLQAGKGAAFLGCSGEDGISWGRGDGLGRGSEKSGKPSVSTLWGCPANSLSLVNSGEGVVGGPQRAGLHAEAHINTTQLHYFEHLLCAMPYTRRHAKRLVCSIRLVLGGEGEGGGRREKGRNKNIDVKDGQLHQERGSPGREGPGACRLLTAQGGE